MGSNLRRQLREALPPSIKGLQRAVALEIADDARWNDDWKYDPEKGRRSKAKLADIVRWTAAKDELSVREMLRRLSVAGWEFRLPIGKGKDGRLLYAVPGMAMQFRVPDFEDPTVVGPSEEEGMEDPTTVGSSDSKGPTVVGEDPTVVGEGPTTVGEGPTVVGPPSPSTSPCSSPKESPSTTSVAEDASGASASVVETEGGGGGGDPFFEELHKQSERVEAFVASLPFRGRPPGKQQQQKLRQRLTVAFKAGWTERGLTRYLDISDAPDVRSAAAVYLHRLSEDELPDAGEAEAVAAGLPPVGPDCYHDPAAATDPKHRVHPITGDPCPKCHPSVVGQTPTTDLPPVCDPCMQANPAARYNVRFRTDSLSFQPGALCPRCHPEKVGGTGARATAHTAADYASGSVDDLYGPRKPLKGDERVQGWYDVAARLGAEEAAAKMPQPQIARGGYQPYRNPIDQSVYDAPWPDPEPFDDHRYEKDL